MRPSYRKPLIFLGSVIIITGILAVAADVLSAWSSDPRGMDTAVSVDFESVMFLFLDKPREQYVWGNYLGAFVLPIFHLAGLYLVSIALKPLGISAARIFLFVGAYAAAIGAGFHGTLAFVGDIVKSGNQALMSGILDYWQPWAYLLVVLFTGIALLLAALIVFNKTIYSRWMFFVSPIGLMMLSTIAIAVLPGSYLGLKSFLAATGLNLPMLIFYITTVGVLLKQESFKPGI